MGRGGSLMAPRGMGDRGRPEMFHSMPHIRPYPVLSLGGSWWTDKKTIHKLNLRPEQSQRMEALFESNRGTLQTLLDTVHREEQRFVEMPREDLRDETKVFAQIDRIAQARADLEKADFHMLLQLRAQLDPDQLAQLDKEIAESTGQ